MAIDMKYLKRLADALDLLEKIYGKKFSVDATFVELMPDTMDVTIDGEKVGKLMNILSMPIYEKE